MRIVLDSKDKDSSKVEERGCSCEESAVVYEVPLYKVSLNTNIMRLIRFHHYVYQLVANCRPMVQVNGAWNGWKSWDTTAWFAKG